MKKVFAPPPAPWHANSSNFQEKNNRAIWKSTRFLFFYFLIFGIVVMIAAFMTKLLAGWCHVDTSKKS